MRKALGSCRYRYRSSETSAMPEPEEIVDFYLDKPFVFVIFDNQTGVALFMGKVENRWNNRQ